MFFKTYVADTSNKYRLFRPQKVGNWHGNVLVYIDNIFLVLFPLAFALFNMLYWPVFLAAN